jgi:hypothetical protein
MLMTKRQDHHYGDTVEYFCNLGYTLNGSRLLTCNSQGQWSPSMFPTCQGQYSQSFPHSWLITGFITRLIWWVPLVEQELLTLPEHMSSTPVLSGVRVTRSLVVCVCFVDRCLSFFFWPLCCLFLDSDWYLQTFLTNVMYYYCHFNIRTIS